MFLPEEIQQVIDAIKFNYSMMITTSLGGDVLSEVDRIFLLSYGIDPALLDNEFPPYMKMFMIGKLTAILEEKQSKKLSKKNFDDYLNKGQFVPLSSREREEYAISREMTYNHLKGLGGKMEGAMRDVILEENKKQIIYTEIAEGIKNRKSIGNIVSELGHKTGEWERDWRRIVVTEMQNIYNQGRASELAKKYGDQTLVWKQVFPLACRHCIRLYLTNGIGSPPKVFRLYELIEHGTNMGQKVGDWLPIVGATHPHCRCDLRPVFKGQIWDEEKQGWVYPEGYEIERKVVRTSKIKVTVGDKVFEV